MTLRTRTTWGLTACGAVLAVMAGTAQTIQTRRPTDQVFRAAVEMVSLNVTVMDQQNHYLTDLTKQDFVVLEDGAATIGRLVERVGVSQPGITRSIARLIEMGLVEPLGRQRDQRFRTVQLTEKGRDLVGRSRREVFPRIEAAVDQICSALKGGLLEQLGGIEAALADASIDQRARRIVSGE